MARKIFVGQLSATICQHARFLKLLDGLRGQNHRGVVLAPRLLRLHDVVADGLVLDEQPCLIEQEHLEGGELLRVGDLVRRPMQNIKQQWLQAHRAHRPSRAKLKVWKLAERERVLGVVEEKSVLAAARPAVQPLLQLADDVAEVRDRALVRLQHIHPLDRVPQLAFFFEVEPVTLFIALDEHTEEAEEKLQVLFGLRQRERVDGEVPRLLADIQVRAAKDRRERLEAAADVEDECQRRILLRVLQDEVAKIRFASSGHPEDQRVGNFAVMQVEKVRRAVVGFKRGQVLRTEMRVRLLAGQDRKQKGQVGIVCIQQVQLAEIHRIVAGDGGEISVELVVGFGEQIAIGVGEDAGELAHKLIEFRLATDEPGHRAQS